jgi:Flp pilus assembly protein TadG
MMPNRPSNPDLSERGSAMLEFALTAVVVFTLIFGVMYLALALYTYEVVNQYARDASRYAMVHGAGCQEAAHGNASCSIGAGDTKGPPATTGPADAALKTYLNGELYPGINGSKLNVSAVYGMSPSETTQCSVTACNGTGDQVAVTVSYNYLYAIPFIPSRSFTMNATSTMTISQ